MAARATKGFVELFKANGVLVGRLDDMGDLILLAEAVVAAGYEDYFAGEGGDVFCCEGD